jgi:hypothetical protein
MTSSYARFSSPSSNKSLQEEVHDCGAVPVDHLRQALVKKRRDTMVDIIALMFP